MKFFTAVGLIIFAVLLEALVCALPIYFLWNWLMPKIFGLVTINFLEAWGIMILARLIFSTQNKSKEQ